MKERFRLLILFLATAFVGAWLAERARPEEPTQFSAEARRQYERGQDLRNVGKLKEAISAYEEAIKLGMQAFPRVHLNQATSNLELQKYDTAIAQYSKFIDKFGLEKSCRY